MNVPLGLQFARVHNSSLVQFRSVNVMGTKLDTGATVSRASKRSLLTTKSHSDTNKGMTDCFHAMISRKMVVDKVKCTTNVQQDKFTATSTTRPGL